MGYNYLRIRRAAKIVDNAEFESLIRTGQLIDLREPADFHRKHILGARNIPSNQLKTSLAALRKDKPVLLYENQRAQRVTNAAPVSYTHLDEIIIINVSGRGDKDVAAIADYLEAKK